MDPSQRAVQSLVEFAQLAAKSSSHPGDGRSVPQPPPAGPCVLLELAASWRCR